jgi:hypothetical protein
MIKILHNLALFWVKNANFLQIFRRKIFKKHNIGPRIVLRSGWGLSPTLFSKAQARAW